MEGGQARLLKGKRGIVNREEIIAGRQKTRDTTKEEKNVFFFPHFGEG